MPITSAVINGFSLKGIQTMETPEGIATKATLCFNDKKIGDYWDAGDGIPYRFYPLKGISEERILEALQSFPPIKSEEFDFVVPWDISILVDKIILKTELLKKFRKASSNNGYLVEAASEKRGLSLCYTIKKSAEEETAVRLIKEDLLKNYSSIDDFEIRVYRSEDDFIISDTEVKL